MYVGCKRKWEIATPKPSFSVCCCLRLKPKTTHPNNGADDDFQREKNRLDFALLYFAQFALISGANFRSGIFFSEMCWLGLPLINNWIICPTRQFYILCVSVGAHERKSAYEPRVLGAFATCRRPRREVAPYAVRPSFFVGSRQSGCILVAIGASRRMFWVKEAKYGFQYFQNKKKIKKTWLVFFSKRLEF